MTMTRDALSRRTSASAVLAAAAILLFLGACAGTKPEPVELTDARLALQDARSAGAAQYAAEKLAAAQAHLVTAENMFKADVGLEHVLGGHEMRLGGGELLGGVLSGARAPGRPERKPRVRELDRLGFRSRTGAEEEKDGGGSKNRRRGDPSRESVTSHRHSSYGRCACALNSRIRLSRSSSCFWSAAACSATWTDRALLSAASAAARASSRRARAWMLSPRARSLCAADRATRARSRRSLACCVAVAFSAARMARSTSETSVSATFGPLDAQPVARGMQ